MLSVVLAPKTICWPGRFQWLADGAICKYSLCRHLKLANIIAIIGFESDTLAIRSI